MSKYDKEYYVLLREKIFYDDCPFWYDGHYTDIDKCVLQIENKEIKGKYQYIQKTDMIESFIKTPNSKLRIIECDNEKEASTLRKMGLGTVVGDINLGQLICIRPWVYDLIYFLESDNFQLFPVTYEDVYGTEHSLYALYFQIFLDAWDRDLSQYTMLDHDTFKHNKVPCLSTLSLAEEVLDNTPFVNRLIFRLDNTVHHQLDLCHKSLVEQIRTHGCEGVHFIRVDKWNANEKYEIYIEQKPLPEGIDFRPLSKPNGHI